MHMLIDTLEAAQQAQSLHYYASLLRDVRGDIRTLQSSLNANWKAEEEAFVSRALDNMWNELNAVSSSLDEIGGEITGMLR